MTRVFEFTEGDFRAIRRFLRRRTGIAISKTQPELVYTRLAQRLYDHGLRSFSEYVDLLHREPEESEPFVNSLTTNHTAFFRENDHFDVLRRFIAQRRSGTLRIWSAGCSSGEEPFSIAMTVAEAARTRPVGATILATDVDTRILSAAREGLYSERSLERVDPALVARYFTAESRGAHRVRPELQRLVTFRHHNLLDETWDGAEYDVIFCRNVMLYFKQETKVRILERLRDRLRPDGLLFTGYAEILRYAQALFYPVGHAVYRRAGEKESAA